MAGWERLDAHEVVPYLLALGLLDRPELTEGRLRVHPVYRRNRSFHVHRGERAGLFVKQSPVAAAAGAIANEANVLRTAEALGSAGSRPLAPRLLHHDQERGVLVAELIEGRPLVARTTNAPPPSVSGCRALGRTLAAVHELARETASAAPRLLENRPPDLIDTLLWPRLGSLGQLSGGQLEYLRLVQDSGRLAAALSALKAAWCDSRLVHMDLRWDNAVLVEAPGEPWLRLVDWETGGWGDPAWDVGSVFAAFVADWVLSIHEREGTSPAEALSAARRPLTDLQPAVSAFWTGYLEARRLQPGEAAGLLVSGSRMCGARLCQTSFETLQNADRCHAGTYRLTQVAHNILERPEQAAIHLLGLPLATVDL